MKGLRKLLGGVMVICLLAVLLPLEALAAGSTITKVHITLNLEMVQGENLEDVLLDTSTIKAGSDRYEINFSETDWSGSKTKEVTIGTTYTLKIYVDATGDDYFKGSYRSSNVTVTGGTFESATRKNDGTLVLTVKTKPVKGQYETPEDAYWRDGGFGKARWEAVTGVPAYEVWLYRGSTAVYKVNTYRGTSLDFYPYMTKEGTYYFKVRSVPVSDTAKKYANKSEWIESDEMYVGKEDVSDGSGKVDYNDNNGSSSGSGGSSSGPGGATGGTPGGNQAVGWVQQGNRWFYRYPDGGFVKNGWLQVNNKWYLFDSDGWMLTGWQKKNEQWYYLTGSGDMVTGWLQAANGWYYMNPTKDSFEGAMVKGQWLGYNNQQYYLGSEGIMYEGWKEIDGNWYYFYPGSGAKAVNTTINSFYVDQNGIWKR